MTQKPEILSCRSAAESEHGDIATTLYRDMNQTNCLNTIDAHIKFIPVKLSFDYKFVLQITPPEENHAYVDSFSVGIVDLLVNVKKYNKHGNMQIMNMIKFI